jgi:heme exporter protein D
VLAVVFAVGALAAYVWSAQRMTAINQYAIDTQAAKAEEPANGSEVQAKARQQRFMPGSKSAPLLVDAPPERSLRLEVPPPSAQPPTPGLVNSKFDRMGSNKAPIPIPIPQGFNFQISPPSKQPVEKSARMPGSKSALLIDSTAFGPQDHPTPQPAEQRAAKPVRQRAANLAQ